MEDLNNSLISIDSAPNTDDQLINIDTSIAPTIQLSDPVSSKRAAKASFGLTKDTDKTYDEIKLALDNGQEEQVRVEAASQVDLNKYNKGTQAAADVVKNKAKLSQFDLGLVSDIMTKAKKPTDPKTVFEDKFAEEYMNYLHWPQQPIDVSPWWSEAMNTMPQQVQQVKEAGQEIVAKREYLLTKAQNLEAGPYKNQPYFEAGVTDFYKPYVSGWVADQIKMLAQPYIEIKKRGNVSGVSFWEGLLGTNISAQRDAAIAMPLPQFKEWLDPLVERLAKDNPSLAISFVNDMLGQTSTDKFINNAFTVAMTPDVLAGAKLGVNVARRMATYTALRKSGIDMAKAAGETVTESPKVVASAASGNLDETAVHQATAQIVNKLDEKPETPDVTVKGLTSNFNFYKPFEVDPSRYGQTLADRIVDRFNATQIEFRDKLNKMWRVDVNPTLLTQENLVRELKDGIKGNWKGINNAVLDVKGPIYHPETNTNHWEIPIGTSDGLYFKERDAAKNNAILNGLVLKPTVYQEINALNQKIGELSKFIRTGSTDLGVLLKAKDDIAALRAERQGIVDLKLPNDAYRPGGEGYEIVQQGRGYYINYTKPLNITDNIMRKGLIDLHTDLPKSGFKNWVNATLGWVRTGEDTLSKAERSNRKIVTHTPSVLMDVAIDVSKDIARVPWKYKQDFGRALKYAQTAPDKNGLQGKFFDNTGDLHDFYMRTFQRPPDPKEIQAYAAYKHLTEFDHSLRNIAVLREKWRLGTEAHNITVPDAAGLPVKTGFFDGIKQTGIPGGDGWVLIMGDRMGNEGFVKGNLITGPTRKLLEKQFESGEIKVIRFYDSDAMPLEGFGEKLKGRHIEYVIAKNVETKPISLDQVPKRGGGHLIPIYEHYLKEADMLHDEAGGIDRYRGDKTIFGLGNRVIGKAIEKDMNEVKRFLRDGDIEGAKNYHLQSSLPFDWDTHYGWYKESKGPEGKTIPPRLDPREPVRIVPKDRTIWSINNDLEKRYPDTFKNGMKEGSLARMHQVEFTGARDSHELMAINDKGSIGNPIYSYEPAELLDPITAMNKGLGRIINSTFMNDYKVFAAEHWLQQAKNFLDVSESQLNAAAMYHFNNPKFKPISSENIREISILKGNWKKANDFIGTPSTIDNTINYVTQSLVDSIYKGTGPKGTLVPTWLLSKMEDPLAYVRNMAFHAYLGLYSVSQFPMQAITYANIFAISPRHAPSGAMATLLYTWSRVNSNPNVLAHMDELATRLRTHIPGMSHFKAGEWLEATTEMRNTGFMNVSHESALRDTPMTNKFIRNGADTFLDYGQLPFERGAEFTRISSWYTAYREFRDANPHGAITRADREGIFNRAGDLDHNMSRASSSILHTGPAAIPTQFFAYNLRLAELMMGKRLTVGEKARLFGVSSLLFGVPAGGLGLFAYPAGDWLRKKAMDTGILGREPYVVGDNLIDTFFMEGLPAIMMAAITSPNWNPKNGNWYNFSKFGAKGIDVLDDFFDKDKSFLDMVGGAPYSFLTGTWQGSSGFRMWAGSFLKNDNRIFPLKGSDIADVFKEVKFVSDTKRLLAAANVQRWISKNETYLTDTSLANAIFQVVTGLNKLDTQDVRVKKDTVKERKEMASEGLSFFLKEMHRSIEAFANRDEANGRAFHNRAIAYLEIYGYPEEKRASALSLAYDSNVSLVKKIDPEFFLKDVPPAQREQLMSTYKRTLQMQQKRGE